MQIKEHFTNMRKNFWILIAALVVVSAAGAQQQAAPAQQGNTAIYNVTVVAKTVTAISYQHRSGSTMIGFQGTPLLPLAKGDAKVDSKQGSIVVSASFRNMQPAQMFGKEYLTYVLWAITPEGKPNNLGELLLDGDKSKLTATTNLQSFGMIVTAEPYFAVNMPSDVVVMENVVRADTVGTVQQVTANYELLQRGEYTYDMSKARDPITNFSPKVPLEVYEARNAVGIAQSAGAETLAPDAYQKAVSSLQQAEALLEEGQQEGGDRGGARRGANSRGRAHDRVAARGTAESRSRAGGATSGDGAADAKQRAEAAARQQAEIQKLQAERNAAQEAAARAQADAAREASARTGGGSTGGASEGCARCRGEGGSGETGAAGGIAGAIQSRVADDGHTARFASEHGGRVVCVREIRIAATRARSFGEILGHRAGTSGLASISGRIYG